MPSKLDSNRGTGAAAERFSLPTVAEAFGGGVTLRRAAGGTPTELTTAEREQLIADARAGKLVSVLVDAVTFIQRAAPNRNYSRFTPQALQRMAPSFAGVPVLRDHEQGDTTARAGRILESKLEDFAGEEGAKQIRMTLELTAPWAVEDALRGLIDRFSIGWHPTGATECSICGSEMMWWWCMGKGDHLLGDTYDGQVCQLVYTAADGIEVSAVSVPAVVGTGVDDIRAQAAAARAASPAELGRKGNPMKTFATATILAALSLGADADEAAAVAGIEKLKTDRDGLEAALKDAQTQLAASKAELAALVAVGQTQRIDAILARGLSEGRYVAGGTVEAHLKKLAAKGDEAGLLAYVDDLPKNGASPVGAPLQSAGADPVARTSAGEVTAATLTPAQKKVADQMGVTHEAYAEQLNKLTRKGGR